MSRDEPAKLPFGSLSTTHPLTCDVCLTPIDDDPRAVVRWEFPCRPIDADPPLVLPPARNLTVMHKQDACAVPGHDAHRSLRDELLPGSPHGWWAVCRELKEFRDAFGLTHVLELLVHDGLPAAEAAVFLLRLYSPGYDSVVHQLDRGRLSDLYDGWTRDLLDPITIADTLIMLEWEE